MDTKTAISTLTSLKATVDSNVAGYTAQSQALQVALDQLNGVLNTPTVDLQEADATIATLEATPIDTIAPIGDLSTPVNS